MRKDAELLEAWRGGDRRAGGELFDRHFDAIHRFFHTKLGIGAEDLVQRTFLACVEGRDRFRGESSVRTYLFATARHILADELRRRGRRQVCFDPSVDSICDADPSPSAVFAERVQERLLLEGLRRIPLDHQIALELQFFEGMTGPQIGEVLGITEPAVRSRLRRAKEQLVAAIQKLERSPDRLESTLRNLEQWASSLRKQLD